MYAFPAGAKYRSCHAPLAPSFGPRPLPRLSTLTCFFSPQIALNHDLLNPAVTPVSHARKQTNTKQVVMGSRPAAARVASANNAHGKGQYRGACGCTYHVRDDARVLYFDDSLLGDVSAVTGGWSCLAGLRRLLCGGRGQAVRVQSRLCCGLCVRARGLAGLPCLPTCCVCVCPSAALRHNMPAKVGLKRKQKKLSRISNVNEHVRVSGFGLWDRSPASAHVSWVTNHLARAYVVQFEPACRLQRACV